jgi:glycine cleavage system H protein
MNPTDLSYSKEHEWVRMEGDDVAVVGITEFAQDSLGDVVFVELPEVGAEAEQFEKMGEIESVKAVSDLYSPVSGSVLERNEALVDSPELVNDSPYDEGWMLRIALADGSELGKLMSASEYQAFLESEDQGH